MGLISTTMTQLAAETAEFGEITAITPFEVIQGHALSIPMESPFIRRMRLSVRE